MLSLRPAGSSDDGAARHTAARGYLPCHSHSLEEVEERLKEKWGVTLLPKFVLLARRSSQPEALTSTIRLTSPSKTRNELISKRATSD